MRLLLSESAGKVAGELGNASRGLMLNRDFTFHCALNPMISYSMYGSDFTPKYPSKDCSVDMLIKIGCPKPPEEFLLRNIQF